MTSYKFPKNKRICSKKEIDFLFENGKSYFFFPYKVIIAEYPAELPLKILITVSKTKLKKATARNKVRRLTREAFRLHSSALYANAHQQKRFLAALIYVHDKVCDYTTVEKGIEKFLEQIWNLLINE